MKKPPAPDKGQKSLLQFFKFQIIQNENIETTQTNASDDANEALKRSVDENAVENVAPAEDLKLTCQQQDHHRLHVAGAAQEDKDAMLPSPKEDVFSSPVKPTAEPTCESPMENDGNGIEQEVFSTAARVALINSPADQPNAYEMERLERIRRNMEVMRNLGLGTGGSASIPAAPQPPKPRNKKTSTKRPAAVQPPPGPVRRSQRHRGSGHGAQSVTVDNTEHNLQEHAEIEPEEELVFDDSSVHKYVCTILESDGPVQRDNDAAIDGSTIRGFSRLPGLLVDPALAKAYSIDWLQCGLVAAGGKNGHVAIWGSQELENGSISNDEGEEEVEIEPLLSSRLHKGWISDVQLLIKDRTSAEMPGERFEGVGQVMLLSAGNDGVVCLWDVQKTATAQDTTSKKGRNGTAGMPRCIAQAENLHSGGIFSVHTLGKKVITGSKDCSVVVSDVNRSFFVVRRYEDLHQGVVKCVRWQQSSNVDSASNNESSDSNVFASCGNDRIIHIMDIRESGSTCTGIVLDNSGHSTAINCLRWSPASEHLLLSASHDPTLVLHDMRKPNKPLHTFMGHSPPNARIKTIYQPAFVAGGTAIATAGEPSDRLSLYSVQDGRTISRGEVDISIGATFCGTTTEAVDAPLLCSANRCVALFVPTCKPL